jgi:hypothetical protein
MTKRSYVLPVGVFTDSQGKNHASCFVQIVDHVLPSLCGFYKPIGGAVESGETPLQAVKREFLEENPGWYDLARIPGTSKGAWNFQKFNNFQIESGFCLLHDSDQYSLYLAFVDVGPVSFRKFVETCKESCPVALNINALAKTKSNWIFPEMYEQISNVLESLNKHLETK